MGRLFWKFFFVFWLVLLTAGVGVGLTVWSHRPPATDSPLMIAANDRAAMDIRLAAALLETQGQAALRELLSTSDPRFPLRVVDQQGQELLGRSLSPELLAHVRQIADQPSTTAAVRRVRSAEGNVLVLFVPQAALPGPGPPPQMPDRPPSPWIPVGFGLVASIFFSALLAWSVAKPIRLLRHAFEEAAHGKLEIRVQPLIGRRQDELGDLCRDFDKMAQRLQTLVTAQRKLFHDVSHELRSPLARIQAAIGLARQNPAKTDQSLNQVERDAVRLDNLVGELLTLARLESGVPGAAVEPLDVNDLMDDLVENARFEAQAKGCTIDYRSPEPITIQGHPELIARAVENVLRNAVRHTPSGGRITVSAQADLKQPAMVVQIEDQGPGVPPSDLSAIFEPFYRGQQKSAGATPGYGLGLAIARRAVEAHRGAIRAVNVPRGGLCIHMHFVSLSYKS